MGAVDFDECPWLLNGHRNCRCNPDCVVCGWPKHVSLHGPVLGEKPGSVPWHHEYTPPQHTDDRGMG